RLPVFPYAPLFRSQARVSLLPSSTSSCAGLWPAFFFAASPPVAPRFRDRRRVRHTPVTKTSFHVAIPPGVVLARSRSPRMNTPLARLTLLALSTALFATACSPEGPATGQAPTADASAPAAAGDRISAEISGAGASFIYPRVSKWSADYNAATGAKVNYQSSGSGGGIAQIKAGTVDFGSSDKPLSSEELAEAGLGQFPSAIGGVVPVLNVEGLQPGQLKLTGALLGDIFLGKIATWNDPAIAALNPGVPLPDGKI